MTPCPEPTRHLHPTRPAVPGPAHATAVRPSQTIGQRVVGAPLPSRPVALCLPGSISSLPRFPSPVSLRRESLLRRPNSDWRTYRTLPSSHRNGVRVTFSRPQGCFPPASRINGDLGRFTSAPCSGYGARSARSLVPRGSPTERAAPGFFLPVVALVRRFFSSYSRPRRTTPCPHCPPFAGCPLLRCATAFCPAWAAPSASSSSSATSYSRITTYYGGARSFGSALSVLFPFSARSGFPYVLRPACFSAGAAQRRACGHAGRLGPARLVRV
jgi:hypothetical protein